MSKKEEVKQEEVVNQPDNAPIAPEINQNIDSSVLAHQWQKDSASLNTNELAGYANSGKSIVDEVNAANDKGEKEKEKKVKISESEKERRSKLDVSHADYLNPSLDH